MILKAAKRSHPLCCDPSSDWLGTLREPLNPVVALPLSALDPQSYSEAWASSWLDTSNKNNCFFSSVFSTNEALECALKCLAKSVTRELSSGKGEMISASHCPVPSTQRCAGDDLSSVRGTQWFLQSGCRWDEMCKLAGSGSGWEIPKSYGNSEFSLMLLPKRDFYKSWEDVRELSQDSVAPTPMFQSLVWKPF